LLSQQCSSVGRLESTAAYISLLLCWLTECNISILFAYQLLF
jgi:hypothetical protein